jgi:hypothetical protein
VFTYDFGFWDDAVPDVESSPFKKTLHVPSLVLFNDDFTSDSLPMTSSIYGHPISPPQHINPEDGNGNVCRNVGQLSTFFLAHSQKPKSYINYNDILAPTYIEGMFKWSKLCIWQDCSDGVVPAAVQGILCGEDLTAGASMVWLPQCPWGLFLMASTPSPRTVPKRVSFEQPLCLYSVFLPLTYSVIITGFQIILILLEYSIRSKFNLKYSWQQSKNFTKNALKFILKHFIWSWSLLWFAITNLHWKTSQGKMG